MRSSRGVKGYNGQCQNCNSPGFDPSFSYTLKIWDFSVSHGRLFVFCRGPDDSESGNSPGNVACSLLPQSRNRFSPSFKLFLGTINYFYACFWCFWRLKFPEPKTVDMQLALLCDSNQVLTIKFRKKIIFFETILSFVVSSCVVLSKRGVPRRLYFPALQ
jgi:hypothetical protein